jgi:hypothetical protein
VQVQVRFSRFLITAKVLTARKEEVGGAETHEMDILGSHTNSVASSLRLVSMSTGQDISDEAQPVISQVEGVTSIWPCCRIQRRLFCSLTGSEGSDVPEIHIVQPSSNDDVSGTTNDRLTQAEVQTRACFNDCRDIIGLTDTKSITADHLTPGPVLATPPQIPHLNKNLKNHLKNHT